MRSPIVAAGCLLLVAGCASDPDRSPDVSASWTPPPNVVTYNVAPPNALPLGPVKEKACNGTREIAVSRLLTAVSRQGGNGVTQLTCSDEGLSFSCLALSSVTCEAIALNVPPPPPPPPPVVKPKPVKHTPPKKPPQRQQQPSQQPWPQQPQPN